jgi:ribokinase
MKILNFGSLNIDYTYSVPDIVKPGQTVTAGSCSMHLGGKGFNQTIALARAGASVTHAGKIGHDGIDFIPYLEHAGVTCRIHTVSEPTGKALIQVDKNGENSIILFGGANRSIADSLIPESFEGFGDGDMLLVQNEINQIPLIIKTAKQKHMFVAANIAPVDDTALSYDLDMIDILMVNEGEGAALAGTENEDEIVTRLSAHCSTVILTLGKRGLLYWSKNSTNFVKNYCVQTVDTTAAGDTFTGFFLAALLKENNIDAACRLAAKAAALCVTRQGAAESIPFLSEVLSSGISQVS